MKKRKPPVLLLSILLVLVGVAVVYGISQGSNVPAAPGGEEHPLAENPQASTNNGAVALRNNISLATKAAGGRKTGPSLQGAQPAGDAPSIAVHHVSPEMFKPKPNAQGQIISLRGQ